MPVSEVPLPINPVNILRPIEEHKIQSVRSQTSVSNNLLTVNTSNSLNTQITPINPRAFSVNSCASLPIVVASPIIIAAPIREEFIPRDVRLWIGSFHDELSCWPRERTLKEYRETRIQPKDFVKECQELRNVIKRNQKEVSGFSCIPGLLQQLEEKINSILKVDSGCNEVDEFIKVRQNLIIQLALIHSRIKKGIEISQNKNISFSISTSASTITSNSSNTTSSTSSSSTLVRPTMVAGKTVINIAPPVKFERNIASFILEAIADEVQSSIDRDKIEQIRELLLQMQRNLQTVITYTEIRDKFPQPIGGRSFHDDPDLIQIDSIKKLKIINIYFTNLFNFWWRDKHLFVALQEDLKSVDTSTKRVLAVVESRRKELQAVVVPQ